MVAETAVLAGSGGFCEAVSAEVEGWGTGVPGRSGPLVVSRLGSVMAGRRMTDGKGEGEAGGCHRDIAVSLGRWDAESGAA